MKYSTGEIAKICNTTIRTVQFYDEKGLLKPFEITEGGRRLYSEDEVTKLKHICMLKELDFSLDQIKEMLQSNYTKKDIEKILYDNLNDTKKQIEIQNKKANIISEMLTQFDVNLDYNELINKKSKNLLRTRIVFIILWLLIVIINVISVFIYINKENNLLSSISLVITLILVIFTIGFYLSNTLYQCDNCKKQFKPKILNVIFAIHMFNKRKLKCPYCNEKSWCVETSKVKSSHLINNKEDNDEKSNNSIN